MRWLRQGDGIENKQTKNFILDRVRCYISSHVLIRLLFLTLFYIASAYYIVYGTYSRLRVQ